MQTLESDERRKPLKLVNENGKWRIFLDWHTQAALAGAGRALERAKSCSNFDEKINILSDAKEKFEIILKARPDSEIASWGLESIKDELSSAEEEKACLNKLSVTNLKVSRSIWADIVVFEIENFCDRTLNKANFIVYCLDENGSEIHEFTEKEYLFLKPNYIDKVYINVIGAPSKWNDKVRVEILDIDFSYSEID